MLDLKSRDFFIKNNYDNCINTIIIIQRTKFLKSFWSIVE